MVISSLSSITPRPSILPIIIILLIISCSASFCAADYNDNEHKPSDDHVLSSNCSSEYDPSKTNITNYSESLNLLLVNLSNSISPGNGGYSKASQAWAQGRLQVYGRAQCRGDVTQEDCKNCIKFAAMGVQKNCSRETILHDHCELKYSDIDVFGIVDFDIKLTRSDGLTLSNETQGAEAANKFLKNLTQTAAYENTGFFAYGRSNEAGQTKFGMAQCTRDILSKGACLACLDSAVRDIYKCCWNVTGVRVILGSCNVRRERFNFLKLPV